MALKGTTKIELTNVHTGEKEVVEHHNMITNVLSDMNRRYCGLYKENLINIIPRALLSQSDPFWKSMFSGIILFEDSLSDNADEYIFPASNKVIGCGDIDTVKTTSMTDSSVSILGNFNPDESVVGKENVVKLVYDFSTSQGNGQISSIALCQKSLSRSLYNYYGNITTSASNIMGKSNNGRYLMKDYTFLLDSGVSRDGNVYTITFYDDDRKNIKLGTRVNYGYIPALSKKTITVDLGGTNYSVISCIPEENSLIFNNGTKFKYVSLSGASITEKDVQNGAVMPYGNYFDAMNGNNYSILDASGAVLHKNYFTSSDTLFHSRGMFDNRYFLLTNKYTFYLVDATTGAIRKFYMNSQGSGNDYDGINNRFCEVFNNTLLFQWGYTGFSNNLYTSISTWQPWLTTKNNLETPVTKTSDKTMKVTYTLTEA